MSQITGKGTSFTRAGLTSEETRGFQPLRCAFAGNRDGRSPVVTFRFLVHPMAVAKTGGRLRQVKQMNRKSILSLLAFAVGFVMTTGLNDVRAAEAATGNTTGSPVLVELFTSEGCSSCPPADRLLQDLDRQQPVPGASVIVLSEHVDYWNHDGWKDPFSSSILTDRQNAYVTHFGLSSAYTPQMIVDGGAEFVGNNSQQAKAALQKALALKKTEVRISSILVDGATLRAHVDTGVLPANGPTRAEVFVVVALNHAESQVLAGENGGHRLTHVDVVRSLTKVGVVDTKKSFDADVRLVLNATDNPANLRVIAFVQASGPGKVLGATVQPVPH